MHVNFLSSKNFVEMAQVVEVYMYKHVRTHRDTYINPGRRIHTHFLGSAGTEQKGQIEISHKSKIMA